MGLVEEARKWFLKGTTTILVRVCRHTSHLNHFTLIDGQEEPQICPSTEAYSSSHFNLMRRIACNMLASIDAPVEVNGGRPCHVEAILHVRHT